MFLSVSINRLTNSILLQITTNRSLHTILSTYNGEVGCFHRTRKRKEIRNLEREIETLIWKAVKEREEKCIETSACDQKDLMQSILEGAMHDQSMGKDSSKRFIVDNCKNIYFAGHESTAVAASWCLMLLALHPEWQARIRTEVAQLSPNGLADINSILQLKTV